MKAIEPYIPNLLEGFYTTVQITLISLVFALALALLLGLGKMSTRRLVRLPCSFVIEFMRGTSVIVQLFWVFFALPLLPLDIRLSASVAAVIVLSLNVGSYTAEVVRGAIQAIPRGQYEAAIALNLSPFTRMRRVILPQAIPAMLPPFGTAAVDLTKASALVGFITVQDLTYWAEQTRLTTGEGAYIYIITLCAYFAFAVLLSAFFNGIALLTPLERAKRRARRGRSWRSAFRSPTKPIETIEGGP